MSNISLLQKNSYLSLVVSDNGIWAHLAYTDYNAGREYILSDFTDLNPLKQRLDDELFNRKFWYEYFDNLEKVFNWDIVDRKGLDLFSFRRFKDEGDGISGIRVLMDENQPFFNRIFTSLREFSNDIALRIIDDKYREELVKGLAERLEYDDVLFVKMDLMDFKISRSFRDLETKKRTFQKAQISWGNEYGLIDAIRNSKLRAFLSTEISVEEMLNIWSNFVLNKVFFCDDPNLLDILRGYSTIQCHSIYQDSKEKFDNFGLNGKSALIVTGQIPWVLGKALTMLSLVDGLELSGNFDTYFDTEERLLSFGRSYISGTSATDIILTRKELISTATRVMIPEIRKTTNTPQVVFGGTLSSVEIERQEIYILSPEFTFKELPLHSDKMMIEGEFKNGAYMRNTEKKDKVNMVSIPGKQKYDSLVVDARPRPVIYGPDTYANRLKLQKWIK
jgi:hypothetical protein